MNVIRKYHFELNDVVQLEMPLGARVLHVAEQRGQLCMWAGVDTNTSLATHTFYVYGTGQPLDGLNTGTHVATFFMNGGQYVWHMFTGPVC